MKLVIKRLFLLFIFTLSPYLWAQRFVEGTITTEKNQIIDNGFITFSNLNDGSVLEYVEVSNNYYKIELKENYSDSIYVTARISGYKSITQDIKLDNLSRLILNFKLEERVDELKEIVVRQERPAVVLKKKDTLSYSVSQIADEDDRKLVDVIDNIPFLDYNKTSGVITYKNQPIKTITLNGRNIVDSNYGVVAKNLNIDIIDRLETIDNYNDNRITADFDNSTDKSLNVVLKKNALQLSLDQESSIGVLDNKGLAGGASLNSSLFNDQVTSFNNISYNNIGANPGGINGSSVTNTFTEHIFGETVDSPFTSLSNPENSLGNGRSFINNSIYGSFNSVLNLSPKTTLKINTDYYNDDLDIERLNSFTFNNNDGDNTVAIENITNYKPSHFNQRFDLESSFSKTDLLKLRLNLDSNSGTRNSLGNDNDIIINELYRNLSVSSDYSKRLTPSTAIKAQLNFSHEINQSEFRRSTIINNDFEVDNQGASINQNRINGNVTHYFKSDAHSLVTNVSYSIFNSNFNSESLIAQLPDTLRNNTDYNNQIFLLSPSYNYKKNKLNLTISPEITHTFLDIQNQNQNQKLTDGQFSFTPSLNLRYNLKNSLLITGYRRSVGQARLLNSINGFYLQDELNLVRNSPSVNLAVTNAYNIGYILTSENVIDSNHQVFVTYATTNGAFIPSIAVGSDNLVSTTNFFRTQRLQNFGINSSSSFFIDKINSRISVSPSFSYSQSPSQINDSNFQLSVFRSYSSNIKFNTTWKGFLNLSLSSSLQLSNSEFEGNQFENKRFSQEFILRLKPNKTIFINLSSQFDIPDLSTKDSFLFLDATITLKLLRNIKTQIIGRNLTNISSLNTVDIDPLSRFNVSQEILSRFIGVSFEFQF